MLVCVTERRPLSGDPLNFSTFNMIFEERRAVHWLQLLEAATPEEVSVCHDQPYSFSGWWSDQGKLVLVFVMLCGRLKGFYRQRRRA
ncbi:hypothetical protein EJB05_41094, partial [Eragrostis curvula]